MLLWLSSCGWFATPEAPPPAPPEPVAYLETGDLDAIRSHGQLRILVSEHGQIEHLPRQGDPHDHEVEVARNLAIHLGLEPVILSVPEHSDVLPWLLEGKGDLAVDSLTITEALSESVRFSLPLGHAVEQVVGRPGTAIDEVADLAGHTVVVRRSSPFWATIEALKAAHPDIELAAADEHLDTEALLHQVATGEIDLTVADDDLISSFLRYRDDVAVLLDVSDPLPRAWAMRPGAEALHAEVDKYLNEAELSQLHPAEYTGDLPQLRERGVLRLLTHNSAATYFLHRGELMGFELELWRRFAEDHGMRLQVVVPPHGEDLLDWLDAGRGDIASAGLTLTPRRLADPRLAWSDPYHNAAEVVVMPQGDTLAAVADLAGRTVVVKRDSAYWESLAAVVADGVAVEVQEAPVDLETEEILARVADGTYPLTVADRHLVNIELAHHLPIAAAFDLTGERPHGAAVRSGDTELLAAINDFVGKLPGSAFFNILRGRYFEDPRRIAENTDDRPTTSGVLSPYDDVVRSVADRYGFDWRLIVSQMYQESRFDPEAKSWVGAQGLMQLMPATAAEMGFDDVLDPADGIEAGIKYMARMRDRFEPDLSIEDRTWFALASYNAGNGHVVDARRLAEDQGWDPDRWFGHTERAMLLLARREYAHRARHGYCRGGEPVDYVRKIRQRYVAYARAVADEP